MTRRATVASDAEVEGVAGGEMNGESVERLMDIILQMKINLAHINETLLQQTLEIREQLGLVFDEERKALERCLSTIDETLQECSTLVIDYQRRYAELCAMRQKLVQLGAQPGSLPPLLPGETIENILSWRLRELREDGRL